MLGRILVLAIAVAVSLAADMRGDELLEHCQAYERFNETQEIRSDLMSAGVCLGFITGVQDTIDALMLYKRLATFVCPPQGLTRGDTVTLVIRYLEKNPKYLELTANLAVIAALQNAFPCGEKQ